MKIKSILLTLAGTLSFAFSTSAQVPNYVPTNGLVGWWPFNGNANDESGNGNNGTINGSVLSTDRFGNTNKSMQFSQNQYIELKNLYQNNIKGYTISAWFKKPQSNANTDGAIVSGSYPGQAPGGLRLNIGTINRFQWQVEDSPGQNGIIQNAPNDTNNYCDNKWHFVVSTFSSQNGLISSSAFKLYIDGSLVQTISNITNWPSMDTTTYAPVNNGNRNTIIGNCGGNFFNFSNSFLGTLDDIGIWNRALTQQEISDLYSAVNCANNTSITPQTNFIATGSTATFTATTSDSNPSYLWQSDFGQGFQTLKNFGNYSGANTANLNISNVQLSENNQPIRVITTSGNCVDTSIVAFIRILDTCITSVTDTLIINAVITKINPPNNINTLLVYPNPANTHIFIDYGNFNVMIGYTLTIVNSIGQTVFTTPINQQKSNIDLSTWTGNGIYFVQLIDPQNNTIENRKIVIQ